MPKYHTISWTEFEEDTKQLGLKLAELNKKWTTIVAVARGGLVLAAIISHIFPVRHIETVCAVSYDDATFEQDSLRLLNEYRSHSEDILVIDDLVDSGKTFKLLRGMLPNAHFASVYAKPTGIPTTQTYYKLFAHDTWLVFPWEEQVESQSVVA